MIISLCLYALFFLYFSIYNAEYLYPVAQLDDGRLCVIYQKNPAHIELWFWNPLTGQAISGLFTRYTPAGLHILPHSKDFSFIDHGLIKIKYYHMDIPQIIELKKPLSHISLIHWIDDYNCYMHAKYGDQFGIYSISRSGTSPCEVETIIQKNDRDFLYPQRVGSNFYYIEKYKNTRCFKSHYYIKELDENKHERVILDFGKQAIAFLTMISDSQGFVIGHPQQIKEKKKNIIFTYYHLFKNNEEWYAKELFTFTLPLSLLLGSDRLYESLLPLLPRKIGDTIYFVSQTELSLAIFTYDYASQTITHVECKQNQMYFVPILTANGIYWGGQMHGGILLDKVKGEYRIKLMKI
jgi:hypothetical protein